jgi:hypothetical protein
MVAAMCDTFRFILAGTIGWIMQLVMGTTTQERVALPSSAEFPTCHLGRAGRQDLRRVLKVPLRRSRVLHLFLEVRRMIEECGAFHISNAFPRCHPGLHGSLIFHSDAFRAPVTRHVPYQRCVAHPLLQPGG